MKIASIQIEPKLGKLVANREKITKFVQKAGEKNVDLMVLPELANSGYNLTRKEVKETAEPIPGKTTQLLTGLAKEYNSIIVIGLNERKDGRFYNSAAVITSNGYQATYRKVHLFDREKKFFEAGGEFRVIQTDHGKIGIMICFDWFFPESTRILALKGANIIAHPANLVLPYCQTAMPIRSLENKVFTITANRIGEERDLEYTGKSQINAPSSKTLTQASKDQEEIITAEIDTSKARQKKITDRNHVFKDIKKQVLSSLLETYKEWIKVNQ